MSRSWRRHKVEDNLAHFKAGRYQETQGGMKLLDKKQCFDGDWDLSLILWPPGEDGFVAQKQVSSENKPFSFYLIEV